MADNLQPGDIVYQNSSRSTSAQAVGSDNQLHGVQLVASPGGDIIYQEDESSNIAMALGDDGNYHRVMLVYSLGGEGGGGSGNLDRIIIKSDTIPAASEETYKRMYIYSGVTNTTYTHGYIYECKGTESYTLDPILFESHTMAFDYTDAQSSIYTFNSDAEAMMAFITNVLQYPQPTNVYTMILTVDDTTLDPSRPTDYGMWWVTCKDSDNNVLVSDYRIYGADLQDYGFVFLNPVTDYSTSEPIQTSEFVWTRNLSNLYWERIDVQPSSGGGSAISTTGTLVSGTWVNNSQTIMVNGVTANNTVMVSPAPISATDWSSAGILCTGQNTNSLTFTCTSTPSANITVNVVIF